MPSGSALRTTVCGDWTSWPTPANADAWTQFTGDDGPHTEHIYALAEDAAGRLWVGTVNAGVSVYSGEAWRNYGVLDGCLGERVFAIAADPDPRRGHVWIGTDQGLVCWSPDLAASPAGAKGTWRTFTRTDGLPSDQIYALAVDKRGRVWVGTECDGLAWADPPYRKWHTVRAAAERSGDKGEAPGLNGGTGPGLPSNLSNDLLVLRNGTVVYSTNYGLGLGRSGGLAWMSWQGLSKQPYKNYCRGLAVDQSGRLWIATRHMGLACLDGRTGDLRKYRKHSPPKTRPGEPPPKVPPSLPDDYVFDVAVTGGGDVWAGTYGGGLARLRGAVSARAAPSPRRSVPVLLPGAPSVPQRPAKGAQEEKKPAAGDYPPLPEPAGPPTLEELNAMLADLAKVPFAPPEKQPVVVRLDDDWLTKGDCLGRYGRYWGCWCAILAPEDYIWGAGPEKVKYDARISTRWKKHDCMRYWVHWLHTKNPNTLEMPPTYCHSRVVKGFMTSDFTRRQAEWDDHGEAYPLAKDGPHLYCTLKVPDGLFTLSLYWFNKDGHKRNNRFRDYRLSIRPHPPGRPLRDIDGFDRRPEVARGRVQDFWNGVYKRFLVRGPCELTIHQDRNHSFNTNISGVFLDLVDEYPVPYFRTVEEHEAERAEREARRKAILREIRTPGARARRFVPAETDLPAAASAKGEADAARRLFGELEAMRLWNPVWQATDGRAAYARLLKWLLSSAAGLRTRREGAPSEAVDASRPGAGQSPTDRAPLTRQMLYRMATTCYYHLGRYEKWEAGQTLLGQTTAREIEKALRWDQKTYSYQGKGYQIVTQYLQEHGLRPGSGQAGAGEGATDLPARAERKESRASGP